MGLPDWLTKAVGRWAPTAYPFRETEEFLDLMNGDIVLVGGMDLSDPNRMVAVLQVDAERRCFLGALVTNELDLATAEDVILDSDHTDLPYRVAVMSGLAMHLWFVQVDERLGAMSVEALEAAIAGYCGAEDDFLISHRGVPLQERMMDLRWSDCEREGDQLTSLARDCIDKRWDEDIEHPYVDPRLIPAPSKSQDGFRADILDILEEETRNGRTRGLSPSCVEAVAGTLGRRILRAYPTIFQPRGSMAALPPVCLDEDDPRDRLLELTKADGLEGAGFIKMIGLDESLGSTRFYSNGRPCELLYETVEEAT